MKPLTAYVKQASTAPAQVTTSVTIDRAQHDFVKRKNLNLSMLLRDWLAELMAKTEQNK